MIPSSTIDLWIQLGEVSGGLAGRSNQNDYFFGGGVSQSDSRLNFLLNFYSDILDWAQTFIPNSAAVSQLGLYTYTLCGKYIPRASEIITAQTGQIITNPSSATPIYISTEVAGVAGVGDGPVQGTYTWTPMVNGVAVLIGAANVNYILVNNTPETSLGDNPAFTFNSATGTITRIGNQWVNGDVVIVPYSKQLP